MPAESVTAANKEVSDDGVRHQRCRPDWTDSLCRQAHAGVGGSRWGCDDLFHQDLILGDDTPAAAARAFAQFVSNGCAVEIFEPLLREKEGIFGCKNILSEDLDFDRYNYIVLAVNHDSFAKIKKRADYII